MDLVLLITASIAFVWLLCYLVDTFVDEVEREEGNLFKGLKKTVYRVYWDIDERFHPIVGFIERGINGYSKRDLWIFDAYVCKILAKGLKEINKDRLGTPSLYNPKTRKWDYDEEVFKHKLNEFLYALETEVKIREDICWKMDTQNKSEQAYEAARLKLHKHMMQPTKWNDEGYPDTYDKILSYKEAKRYEDGKKLFAELIGKLAD